MGELFKWVELLLDLFEDIKTFRNFTYVYTTKRVKGKDCRVKVVVRSLTFFFTVNSKYE